MTAQPGLAFVDANAALALAAVGDFFSGRASKIRKQGVKEGLE